MKFHQKRRWPVVTSLALVLTVTMAVLIASTRNDHSPRKTVAPPVERLALWVIGKMLKGDEIRYGFHVIDGEVIVEGRNHGSEFVRQRVRKRVAKADPASFRALNPAFQGEVRGYHFGIDKRSVFVWGEGGVRTLDADASTFRLLDPEGRYACDDKRVFYMTVVINRADPKSFKRLKGDFSIDRSYVYIGHQRMPADASTFEALSPGRISDIWSGGTYDKRQTNYSTDGWCRDANHVFWGNRVVDLAHTDTIEYLDLNYCKDDNHVFCKGEVVENADPNSFRVLGTKYMRFFPRTGDNPIGDGPDARDRNVFFSMGTALQQIRPVDDRIPFVDGNKRDRALNSFAEL